MNRLKTILMYALLFIGVFYFSSCADCHNGVKDGNEIGIDCGGSCPDCPTCFDNLKNGNENGIDCGGDCSPCFPVVIEKEILIRNTVIVDNTEAKTGRLSFGNMLERLTSPTITTKDILLSFLTTWDNNQSVNNIQVNSRPNNRITIINPWKIQEVGSLVDDNSWNPIMDNAPFRLLAINSRFDLANFSKNKVGEGRLTYGLKSGNSKYTMIFECNLEGSNRNDQIVWMKRWHKLSSIDQNSQEYLDSLISIVLDFSSSPSDLSQLRTNEFLSIPKWEFREFTIESDGLFHEATRKASPTTELNGQQLLLDYINIHGTEINNATILETFQSQNILAGNTLYDANFTWEVSGASPEQQEKLETLTFISCVGCHGGLVPGTFFTHIKPRIEGQQSNISGFLQQDLLGRAEVVSDSLELQIAPSILKTIDTSRMEVLRTEQVDAIKLLLEKFKDVKRVH